MLVSSLFPISRKPVSIHHWVLISPPPAPPFEAELEFIKKRIFKFLSTVYLFMGRRHTEARGRLPDRGVVRAES